MSPTGASQSTEVTLAHPTGDLITSSWSGDDSFVQEGGTSEHGLDIGSQRPRPASPAQVNAAAYLDRHLYDDPCYYLG